MGHLFLLSSYTVCAGRVVGKAIFLQQPCACNEWLKSTALRGYKTKTQVVEKKGVFLYWRFFYIQ
jgi:hypothetical protein